jgi:hypothetical protein
MLLLSDRCGDCSGPGLGSSGQNATEQVIVKHHLYSVVIFILSEALRHNANYCSYALAWDREVTSKDEQKDLSLLETQSPYWKFAHFTLRNEIPRQRVLINTSGMDR